MFFFGRIKNRQARAVTICCSSKITAEQAKRCSPATKATCCQSSLPKLCCAQLESRTKQVSIPFIISPQDILLLPVVADDVGRLAIVDLPEVNTITIAWMEGFGEGVTRIGQSIADKVAIDLTILTIKRVFVKFSK